MFLVDILLIKCLQVSLSSLICVCVGGGEGRENEGIEGYICRYSFFVIFFSGERTRRRGLWVCDGIVVFDDKREGNE